MIKDSIDVAVFAHFHQSIFHPLGDGSVLVCSGCWDGGDDFSCNALGVVSGGEQVILLQTPEVGITSNHRVIFCGRRAAITFPDASGVKDISGANYA